MQPLIDPIKIFADWFEQAKANSQNDATAMTLATVDNDGQPCARTVLLKAFDGRGFVFYTNLASRKAKQLAEHPKAALCFFWPEIDKQIRVEGDVEPVSTTEADHYFATRPRGSQIGAWASKQSDVLFKQEELLERIEAIEKRFENTDVPRPEFWSGFRVLPNLIEFWRRGDYRLHERLCYTKKADGSWATDYLYP